MERVAVIILNWNGEKLLREYLPSVVRHTPVEIGKVVVADNHSDDNSVELLKRDFPSVEVLHFDKNYGFAEGYNRAIAQIETEYIVLLNSDVEVASGWLQPLVETLDKHPDVAALQPKIKSWVKRDYFEYAGASGGYIDRYGFPFCRGRILEVTERDMGQYDNEASVFWCSGAALCVRRQVFLDCGGLDERFFAHMEEIDLCWRMQNAGYILKVLPRSVVYHLGGGTLPMNHPRKLFLNYRNNLLMLHKNLIESEYKKVMRVRRGLDTLTCLIFLLKGQIANARSVCEAYRSFREMKKYYPRRTDANKLSEIYPGSLLYAYFFRKIRTFAKLEWK